MISEMVGVGSPKSPCVEPELNLFYAMFYYYFISANDQY
jgi:hypothetical protein